MFFFVCTICTSRHETAFFHKDGVHRSLETALKFYVLQNSLLEAVYIESFVTSENTPPPWRAVGYPRWTRGRFHTQLDYVGLDPRVSHRKKHEKLYLLYLYVPWNGHLPYGFFVGGITILDTFRVIFLIPHKVRRVLRNPPNYQFFLNIIVMGTPNSRRHVWYLGKFLRSRDFPKIIDAVNELIPKGSMLKTIRFRNRCNICNPSKPWVNWEIVSTSSRAVPQMKVVFLGVSIRDSVT